MDQGGAFWHCHRGGSCSQAINGYLCMQDGDPYRDEMEQCVGMIMDELSKRGWNNHYSLAYQSRVGPVGALFIPLHLLKTDQIA